MTAKLTAASPVLYGNTGLKRFQTNSGTDSLFNVALNDSQITVFFYDDYKIKTGSESSLTSRLRGDDEPFIAITPAPAGVQNI
jgi:hypothetical protein